MLVYWFLPMILFLGIATSYEDIKLGKIRNKWILMAIGYSVIVNAVLFSLNYYNIDYLIKFLANDLLSLIVGFVIWYANLWTAGDAKLLFAFTILIPIHSPHSYFFFLTFLSNIFIPISIIFLIHMLFKTSYRRKLFYFKKTFNVKAFFSLIFFIFGFSWAINSMFKIIGLRSNIVLSLLGISAAYYLIERVLKIKIIHISLLLSLVRLVFDSSIYSFKFVKEFSILIFLFLLVRIFLFSMGSEYFTKEVKFNELKNGMIPAETVFEFKGKYFKRLNRFSLARFAEDRKIGKPVFKNLSGGLSREEIKTLNFLGKKLPFKTLRIQTAMPFAPFLFIGALLTIIFQGNFIRFLFL